MFCCHCGHELRASAGFCDSCGQSAEGNRSFSPWVRFWGRSWAFESKLTQVAFFKFIGLTVAGFVVGGIVPQVLGLQGKQRQAFGLDALVWNFCLFLALYFVGHIRGYRTSLRETVILAAILNGCLFAWAVILVMTASP